MGNGDPRPNGWPGGRLNGWPAGGLRTAPGIGRQAAQRLAREELSKAVYHPHQSFFAWLAGEAGTLLRKLFSSSGAAAVAERGRVTVLHYDGDYDFITQVTGQPMQWVVPRATIP